ncbi:hypothetical protein SAY86_008821 [Trapa natans]|uniref:Uncharacterized protein n=1 Tax=Trapa natans TaxID=22666 RepID=A0AAN7QBR0_TRANT|nr:hypothetical protein SAY86_008821 [Trapa natans]
MASIIRCDYPLRSGSLGAQYNGVLLTNLTIALFALVAIESNSQKLARIYAALLFCAISLDIAWFILFTRDIWSFSSKAHGEIFIFSVKLTLAMQIVGCTVRIASSFIWIQIYRLGVSYISIVASPEADFDLRNSFLSPVIHSITRQSSDSDAVLGEAIYDPHHFSSLFEGSPNARSLDGCNHSFSIGDGSQQNSSVLRLSEVDEI